MLCLTQLHIFYPLLPIFGTAKGLCRTLLKLTFHSVENVVVDSTVYIRWWQKCLGTLLCSDATSYQPSYFCCVFLSFFFPSHNVEICLCCSLTFSAPTGSNKLQTCFSSEAPHLHYPLSVTQAMPLSSTTTTKKKAILVSEEFLSPAPMPLSCISMEET